MNTINIRSVPTNIITGFLGVGKTSAILQLLKNKPTNERWAVLVNEFGEIGIDGSMLKGQHSEQQGVFIREVPGGCMCCAAGVPMQIALNQLLKSARPDRLLIEPTGLGHPKEVMQVLSAKHYQSVLTLQKTLTLVDARNLSDARYTSHDTFNQQIAMADTVIGNKLDLYLSGDKEKLISYVKERGGIQTDVFFSQQGKLPLYLLDGATTSHFLPLHHHVGKTKPLVSDMPIPDCGFIKAINKGEGYTSIGWRFSSSKIFEYDKLSAFLKHINVQRMKAVFKTNAGEFAYNLSENTLGKNRINSCLESRIEIITEHINDKWEAQLIDCIVA